MSKLHFETPENVSVHFSPAGLGTRYVAWFADQVIVALLLFAIILLLACAGTSFHGVEQLFREMEGEEGSEAAMYFIGLVMLIWGLGSFVYFGACELFLRGQTPGKRMSKIRVVKTDGFALDAPSILVRNVFRVLDHIPLLWIVPVLSVRAQRTGDMVAGTVVVNDEQTELSTVRVELAERSALESEFRFDGSALSRLTETDLKAVETLLERWGSLSPPQRERLAARMIDSLTTTLQVEKPVPHQRVKFLEDVLAAESRRQQRGLG